MEWLSSKFRNWPPFLAGTLIGVFYLAFLGLVMPPVFWLWQQWIKYWM